jgi:hypothetical protein
MTSTFRFAATLAAVAVVAACSSTPKKVPPPCPRVSILADAAHLTQFRPGEGRDITDVQLQAEITSYHGTCDYDWDKQIMTVSLQVGIDADRGAGAKERQANLSYFVAIPAFFPSADAKSVIPVPLTFPSNTDRIRYVDDQVDLAIPIKKLSDMSKYEIFIGFQLDQDQIDYNRRQHISQ